MDFNPELLTSALTCDLDGRHTDPNKVCAIDSLKTSIFKKWIPEDTRLLEDVAIAGFKTANARCALQFSVEPADELYAILHTAKYMIYDMFFSGPDQTNWMTLDRCLGFAKAGPGASLMTHETDFYSKMFYGNLSTTSILLYHHYRGGISPRWERAELLRSSKFQVDVVDASKLATVPKNSKTNRTICTEPSLNMFYQLGAGLVINKLLERYHNIWLHTQQRVNRQLAREGSLSGQLATIDLSSASDTISLGLCEWLLPPAVMNTLGLLRCTQTRYGEEVIPLRMISSMGNGFTFPLQTLIFATLVRATYQCTGITPYVDKRRNYAVNGDDIICLSSRYDSVVAVLTRCGFIVNKEKSFHTGPFRESCGGDYFNGYPVRGVYLTSVKTADEAYSAFNRLSRWSAYHKVSLTETLKYLKGLVEFRPIPFDAGEDEGIMVPRSILRSPKVEQGCIIYHPYSAIPRTRKITIDDVVGNPDGALISSVGGYLRGQRVTLRSNVVARKVLKKRTPSWDFLPWPDLTIRDFELVWSDLI